MNKQQEKDWEKEFDKRFKDIGFTEFDAAYCEDAFSRTSGCWKLKHIKDFISNLLIQQKKENYRDIPMGVSQWRNHGKKWHYWEFFAKEERKALIKEFLKIVGEDKIGYMKYCPDCGEELGKDVEDGTIFCGRCPSERFTDYKITAENCCNQAKKEIREEIKGL